MPIHYSQNCIQATQNKLNKYMKKIQNHYLRDHLKYKYIKKFYITLKNKKSMISLLHQDIISFIQNDSSIHKRSIMNYHPSNMTFLRLITEIVELVMNYVTIESSESSESSESQSESDNEPSGSESECDSSED